MRVAVFAAAALASLACASSAGHTVAPKGIRNTGNFCYLAAMLQTLFWVPELRTHVLSPPGDEQPSAVHLALAQLFVDMQSADTDVVNPAVHLSPVLNEFLATSGSLIQLGQADDADAFFRLLVGQVFHSLDMETIQVRFQERGLMRPPGLENAVLVLPTRNIQPSNGVQVYVHDNTSLPIHELLAPGARNTLRFVPEDLDYHFLPVAADGTHADIPGVGPFSTVSMALHRLAVPIGTALGVYFQQRIVGPLPRVLVISASKFGYSAASNRVQWHSGATTLFQNSFELVEQDDTDEMPLTPDALYEAGLTGALGLAPRDETPGRRVAYELHSIVFFKPGDPHYVAAVCTNPAAGEWTYFDDAVVVPLLAAPVLDARSGKVQMYDAAGRRVTGATKRQPYMFVYARADVREAWVAGRLATRPVAPGVWPGAVSAARATGAAIIDAIGTVESLSYAQAQQLAAQQSLPPAPTLAALNSVAPIPKASLPVARIPKASLPVAPIPATLNPAANPYLVLDFAPVLTPKTTAPQLPDSQEQKRLRRELAVDDLAATVEAKPNSYAKPTTPPSSIKVPFLFDNQPLLESPPMPTTTSARLSSAYLNDDMLIDTVDRTATTSKTSKKPKSHRKHKKSRKHHKRNRDSSSSSSSSSRDSD